MSQALLARIVAAGVEGIALAALDAAERIAVERGTLRGEVRQEGGRVFAAAVAAPSKPEKKGRDPLDRYYTPARLAALLTGLLEIDPPRLVVEPSCGPGAFVRAAQERWPGALVLGIDLDPDLQTPRAGAQALSVQTRPIPGDFLAIDLGVRPDLVLGNPPFARARAFVERSLEILRPGGVCAFLLPATIGHLRGWSEIQLPSVEIPLIGRPSFLAPSGARTEGSSGFDGPKERGGNARTEYSFFAWTAGEIPSQTLREPGLIWRQDHPTRAGRNPAKTKAPGRVSVAGAGVDPTQQEST